ncbi:MAG: hypothetical protein JRN35_06155 [Nitrososphaerota archaeon]|nr:hypothetical protein [Nitrososphaerota archaeon]
MIPVYRATAIPNTPLVHVEDGQGRSLVSDDYGEVLKFLLTSSLSLAPASVPRAVWRLGEFMEAVYHILPKTAVEAIKGKSNRWTQEGDPRYRLYLQPGKFFSVNINHQEVSFYGISEFFPDGCECWTVDAVQLCANRLEESFKALGVTHLTHLKSPVAVVEDAGLLDEAYDTLPTREDVPAAARDVLEYAQMCDGREWVENYQVGDFPELWSYDMTAAYPYQASLLPDLRHCNFVKDSCTPSDIGFLRGKMTIYPDASMSPILAEVDDRLVNPVGVVPREFFHVQEVKAVLEGGYGSFEARGGWYVVPLFSPQDWEATQQPLDSIMRHWWQKRLDSPDDLTSFLVKRVMNGIIGRLGEWRKGQPCRLTNPIYHATILTNTSLRVAQFLVDHDVKQSELVTVNVDGVKVRRRLDVPVPDISRRGQWHEEGCEPTTVLSPNLRLTGEKREAFLSALKDNPNQVAYGDIDLGNLSTMQDRVYRRFPVTGREFLKGPYVSEPVEVK